MIPSTTTNFDSQDYRNMMNKSNFLQKFNGIVVYKGVEIQAKSETLNGLYEFGEVLDYKKVKGEIFLLIEFCGDNGIWNEYVSVVNCKSFNKLNYIRF